MTEVYKMKELELVGVFDPTWSNYLVLYVKNLSLDLQKLLSCLKKFQVEA